MRAVLFPPRLLSPYLALLISRFLSLGTNPEMSQNCGKKGGPHTPLHGYEMQSEAYG